MSTGHTETVLSQVARLPRRWLSPTLFALIALCFLLPFGTVSCDNASTSFTGVELVTRTVPEGGVLAEAPDCSTDISMCVERQASLTAQVALALALIGLVLGFLGAMKGPGWVASGTFTALVALALEPFDMLGPDVTLRSGIKLALLLSVWLCALHGWRARRRRRIRRGHHAFSDAEARPDAQARE